MLRKYYNHVVAKEDEAKKDGGDRGAGGFPTMENVFLIFGGGGRRWTCPAASANVS
jgi:hypothetical protein